MKLFSSTCCCYKHPSTKRPLPQENRLPYSSFTTLQALTNRMTITPICDDPGACGNDTSACSHNPPTFHTRQGNASARRQYHSDVSYSTKNYSSRNHDLAIWKAVAHSFKPHLATACTTSRTICSIPIIDKYIQYYLD